MYIAYVWAKMAGTNGANIKIDVGAVMTLPRYALGTDGS